MRFQSSLERYADRAHLSEDEKGTLLGIQLTVAEQKAVSKLLGSLSSISWSTGYDEGVLDSTERMAL